ncbi:MAG: FkbM family methyltransferase [Terriglobales bacterium]
MTATRTRILNTFRSLCFQATTLDRFLPAVTAGRQAEELLSKLPPNPGQYRKPTIRRATRDGISFELDLSDFMEWAVYFGITIEPRTVLYGLVRANDVAVDIGANIGEVALNLAKRVGEKGAVHAFEANPLVYEKLLRNLSLNSSLNVIPSNVGLSDQSGSAQMWTPEQNRGGGTISDVPAGARAIAIQLVRFDDVWNVENSRLDLIKLDVEGHELKVLRGAEGVLRRYRPKLFVELDDNNLRRHGASARELLAFLESFGYKCTDPVSGEVLHANSDFAGKHLDFVGRAD